ncbi:NlpC/P60 family protein [Kitasatospora sp. NPDC098652]|uniref:C40 family peptidase n=1 Tax=Kitasatospora sp. NPDC098652 TaxID=3364095 RepID=UPI003808502A
MGNHRKPNPPSRARLAVVTTAMAGTAVLASATSSHAEPKPSVDAVKTQVEALNEQAEASIEKYNGFKEKQQKLQTEANQIQERVASGQEKINGLRTELGGVAAEQYRNGGIDPTVQLMLSSSPESYLTQASMQGQVASSQADLLKQLQSEQRGLDQDRAEATATLAELDRSNAALAAEKKGIQDKLSQAQALLNKLSAEERARVNAQDAAATRASRAGSRNEPAPTYQGPATGRAADAVKFAYAQLGKPYVWGATGPGSFDCSGLTGAAWKAAGVSLPRISQDQWNAGKRVSRADLQPGDLVFFYSDLHHVGLYIGDGKMIHAPRTGKNVEILPIDSMDGPFMGGVRP